MTDAQQTTSTVPPDDGARPLFLAGPDDPGVRHIAMVGDTYTILLSGEDTGGRFALIDMLIPAGNGPPAHRHDFDEMFHVLEGEIEVTYRGQTSRVRAGQTANVPANAPHAFRNAGDQTVRLLCMVSPAGLEEYFAEVGDAVQSRTSPAPELDEAEAAARMARPRASPRSTGSRSCRRADPAPPTERSSSTPPG
jgi:quercetin dioxygenase-like cupin family protein